jgi:cyclophilin family peptidyl-prolyl cis-trans isomerase
MRIRSEKIYFLFCCTVIAVFAFSGCGDGYSKDDPILAKPPSELSDEEVGRIVAVVTTNFGGFRIGLKPDKAPLTTRHFIGLVQKGFYDGLSIFEIRNGYWIKGGDPNGDGTGGSYEKIALETPSAPHLPGTIALDHPLSDPNGGSSIFYIVLTDMTLLKDDSYTVFGEVIDGMPTVQRINALKATQWDGKPRPFMPLNQITILDMHLEARKK